VNSRERNERLIALSFYLQVGVTVVLRANHRKCTLAVSHQSQFLTADDGLNYDPGWKFAPAFVVEMCTSCTSSENATSSTICVKQDSGVRLEQAGDTSLGTWKMHGR
jgi:hypothetical protein